MDKDFNEVNKQIAGFIIVSAAMAIPVCVSDISYAVNADPLLPSSGIPVVDRYAGPVNPMLPTPSIPVVDRYAGPVNPMLPSPSVPVIDRYAGPVNPIPTPDIPVIARYAGPVDPTPTSPAKSTLTPTNSSSAEVNNGGIIPNEGANLKVNSSFDIFRLRKIDAGHFVSE